jgi:hypothetical protein
MGSRILLKVLKVVDRAFIGGAIEEVFPVAGVL